MKRFAKSLTVAALAASLLTVGTVSAQAHGWAIAGGVLGGLALGTAIGATVANASAPACYVSPPPVYTYAAPAPTYAYAYPAQPAVVVAPPAPVVYSAPVVYAAPYPSYYPAVRVGYYWGPRYRHFRR